MFMYTAPLAGAASKKVLDLNLTEAFPEAKPLSTLIAERDSAKQIAADQKG
jgi:hypothetical protein